MTFLAEKLEDRPRLMPEPSPTVSCSAAPRAAVIRAEPKPSPSPTAAASPTPEKILVKQGDEIVSMALEDYLLGVLAAEMPADFEPEALRAQAVAARSYTLYCAQSGKHHDAQVCTDFGCCQAWKSEEKMQESWGEDFEEKRAKLAGAVEDTAGQYLSYGGEPVFAAFHSSSAGQTEDCGAIWSALPYLKSVESPEGEEDVPGYVSRLELSPLDFRDCLLHASPGTDFSGEESGWIGEVFHEDSIRVQSGLGSDIAMAFDECIEIPSPKAYVADSCQRTYRWLVRCKEELERCNSEEGTVNPGQVLFGINQGTTFRDLRLQHMEQIAELDLPGYAVGGLAVGESTEEMYEVLDFLTPAMPVNKPRYLMGVGTPENIVEGVYRGIDFFDCVMPARNGRHAKLYTSFGTINLKNERFERDPRPIEEGCGCPVCRRYSRAYLRHLFKVDEILALRFGVLHNLWYYNQLMEDIRNALEEGRFEAFRREFYAKREKD